MRSLLPLAAAGGAGLLWHSLPRWVKVPAVIALLLLCVIELNKDTNESWFSAATYGGAGEQGSAQMVDPTKTLADSAAGREVSGAKRTVAAQWEGLAGDARQKIAAGDAASLTEAQLLARQRSGTANMTDAIQLETLKKLRSEAESASAQATAARAQALADKETAQLNSRLIESLQKNDGDILKTFWTIFMPKGVMGK